MYLLLTTKSEGQEPDKYLVNMEHVHVIWALDDGTTALDYQDEAQLIVLEGFDQIANWLSQFSQVK